MSDRTVFQGTTNLNITDSASPQTTHQSTSPPWTFSSLPGEVRNIIYDLIINDFIPKDTTALRVTRLVVVRARFPNSLKAFAKSSRRVCAKLMSLILGKYTWVADLDLTDIDTGNLRVANRASWLKASDHVLLDSNIYHIIVRLKRWPTGPTDSNSRVNQKDIFCIGINIQLLGSAPHSSVQVDVRIRCPFDEIDEAPLEADLRAVLKREISAELQNLVSAKLAMEWAPTSLTVADWNQIVGIVGTTFKTWFMAPDWSSRG